MNNQTVVYFVECQGFIKIAKYRYRAFLNGELESAFKWGYPLNGMKCLGFILFHTEEGASEEKAILKERFKHLKHRNDWYREDSELHDYIQKHAEALNQQWDW